MSQALLLIHMCNLGGVMFGFKRAKVISYNAENRTAKIHIHGLTDGSDGLTATLAYPVGDDDRDTEVNKLKENADVFIFFEEGEQSKPVIALYASHGEGAEVDTRRIRQENIEILANQRIFMQSEVIDIDAKVNFLQGIHVKEDINCDRVIKAKVDVQTEINSLNEHYHKAGNIDTSAPIPKP